MKEWCEKEIYIFGAHSRARTLGVYLTYLNPGLSILSYLTDNEEDNPEAIDGVPVIRIHPDSASGKPGQGKHLETDTPVYIATRGVFHEHITEVLRATGFEKIIPVTPELDRGLRKNYLKKYLPATGRSFRTITDLSVNQKDNPNIAAASDSYATIHKCVGYPGCTFEQRKIICYNSLRKHTTSAKAQDAVSLKENQWRLI